ncbi:MAG: YitT family protein, partial [Desulfobacteraceae bacterium]|nr:YitT family protein [Desulfobacteraceae bacterium]
MDSEKTSAPTCTIKPGPRDSAKRIASNIFLLTLGNIIYAAGINSIIIPQHFLSGGVMGTALIVHYFLPIINTGYAYFLLNIPLFLLGW